MGYGHKTALCGSWGVGARCGRPIADGTPACLIVERPSAALAEFSFNENIPCSAPSTAVTPDRHGGRNGRLTAVTQVFYNTCVTV